ncbi:Flp pilus assembly protein TadG [Hoeflea sp. IMCC20628]|uniref:TadE/TadG family type IV pilus assembly protein n=1 Tax=Hoeflea sp. IMCC20628 TaxID=1620421 RepID=UPI00063AF442|nr:pilus assembly protein TadG-related protein [Hoeflea sp. IMCC20628]AKI01517.1 Flp pilus assembly protein TadG [Hoeflea sp. IMCC20628]
MLLRLFKNRSGNFGMMAALLLVPVFGAAGLAVDYSNAISVKTQVQGAADAAALAAVAESSVGVEKALAMSEDGEVPLAKADAINFFKAQLENETGFTVDEIEAKVVKKDGRLFSVINYKVTIPTTLSRVLGRDLIQVAGQSTVEYQTELYRDFYLLLDNTPSMGVGATPADVTKMVDNTSDNCAFACHIVKDGIEDTTSYYNLAKSLGVTTRINVVAQAAASLMDTAKDSRKSIDQYQMAVYTFGEKAEDTKLLEVVKATSDLSSAKIEAAKVDLMSIPKQGYDNDQQTDFDRALTQMVDKMGTPGSGLTSASREKILFFVSDGVGDSYKPSSCTKKTTGGRCQEPIDIAYCTALKDQGYKIAVLYTTYLPLPTNNWYNSWIKPFQNEIPVQMEACATPGLFFEVSPTEGISEAMTTLFKKIINTPRLTG